MVRMKRLIVAGFLTANLFGQAAPVVGVDDPEALFVDKDPKLHRNKQAAMHIVRDMLEASHWEDASKYLTERYIQHNPQIASGRKTVTDFFGKATPQPIPDKNHWRTKMVAVVAEGDYVVVSWRTELPDPRNPGQTYTTTHFDMWRFVDGKADEHWDEGRITAPGGSKGKQ